MALNLARNSKAKLPRGAINVAPLKLGGWHFKMLRDAFEVGLSQVDEAFLRTTIDAARLAFEAQAFHTAAALTLDRNCRIRSMAAIRFS